jgi:hypothetical protein
MASRTSADRYQSNSEANSAFPTLAIAHIVITTPQIEKVGIGTRTSTTGSFTAAINHAVSISL